MVFFMRGGDMDNSEKVILSLCGGTGAWEGPYKEAGYTTINVTLPDYDVRTYKPVGEIYGVLAAPPCTEFSLARNRYNKTKPRDFVKGMEIVNACMRIILQCQPAFWALENPVGMLSRFLGKAPHTFHPWHFGDPYTKFTALWGNFNMPERKFNHIEEVISDKEMIMKVKRNIRKLPSISDLTSGSQSARRAITPQGFAEAFYRANR